ncbi:MAG: DUF4234 domain-containing protein [Candidatus Dormibacteraeota bacterium]|nr:DUF4234 domain-containing protein [Candidatus Dormibacteraeota bacterium]
MPELREETLAAEANEAETAEPGIEAQASAPRRRHKPSARPRTQPDTATAVMEPATVSTAGDVELGGRPEAPPPAHGGWDLPPAPSMWSYPAGVIAGRDTTERPAGLIAGRDSPERHKPLEAPVAPSLGPEGKRRSPWVVAALSVLTLVIYALVWHHRVNVEVTDFDTRMYVRAGRSTIAVFLAWFLGLITSVAGAVLVVSTQMHVMLPYRPPLSTIEQYLLLGGLLVVPYLILALPFCILAVSMTLERVRIAEDRAGRPTDMQLRPVSYTWLLAIPVAGGLVLMGLVQRRLNQVWELVAPAPPAQISEY